MLAPQDPLPSLSRRLESGKGRAELVGHKVEGEARRPMSGEGSIANALRGTGDDLVTQPCH
jgi:hypothetical protein